MSAVIVLIGKLTRTSQAEMLLIYAREIHAAGARGMAATKLEAKTTRI